MEQHKPSIDFWKFLIGQTLSIFGSSFTAVALPLVIYQLTHSSLNLAFSFAAGRLPYLFFGLFAGAYADRANRKRLMMQMNLLSTLAIASVPVLYFFTILPLWWIYVVAFLITTFDIFFQAAGSAAVPRLVPTEKLAEANGRVYALSNAATLVGPLVAGVLFGFLPIVSVLLFDAFSYVISVVTLFWIQTSFNLSTGTVSETKEKHIQRSIFKDIGEGLAYIWKTPLLRSVVILVALVNLQISNAFGELVLFAKQQLGASDFQYSLLAASGSLGVVVFSLSAKYLRGRFSFGYIALGALAGSSATFIFFSLSQSIWVALPLWLLWSGLLAVYDVNIITLRQTIVPDRLLGRVVTSSRVIGSSLAPLAALLGGYLIALTNVKVIFLGLGILTLLACMGFVFSPLGSPSSKAVQATADEKPMRS